MHGGEPHHDPAQTRRSPVFHYFRRSHIGYYELPTGRRCQGKRIDGQTIRWASPLKNGNR